jgi:hypothetical protein
MLRGLVKTVIVIIEPRRVLVEAVRVLVEGRYIGRESDQRDHERESLSAFKLRVLVKAVRIGSVPNIRNGLFRDTRNSAEGALISAE